MITMLLTKARYAPEAVLGTAMFVVMYVVGRFASVHQWLPRFHGSRSRRSSAKSRPSVPHSETSLYDSGVTNEKAENEPLNAQLIFYEQ